MRRTTLLVCALAGCSALEAAPPGDLVRIEEPAKLNKALDAYFKNITTFRTYIQTDKPLYQPGETIWFRADLRATKTLTGAPPGGVTMQLISPRGAIVATKRVLAQGG